VSSPPATRDDLARHRPRCRRSCGRKPAGEELPAPSASGARQQLQPRRCGPPGRGTRPAVHAPSHRPAGQPIALPRGMRRRRARRAPPARRRSRCGRRSGGGGRRAGGSGSARTVMLTILSLEHARRHAHLDRLALLVAHERPPDGDSFERRPADGSARPSRRCGTSRRACARRPWTVTSSPTLTAPASASDGSMMRAERRRSSSFAICFSSSICSFLGVVELRVLADVAELAPQRECGRRPSRRLSVDSCASSSCNFS